MSTLNHSSDIDATIVLSKCAMFATMVEYRDRLQQAMDEAGLDVGRLAKAIGVSYQAVKKVVDGKSKAFDVVNNFKAARILGVRSDWLAVGELPAKSDSADLKVIWPFEQWIPYSRITKLNEGDLGFVAAKIAGALDELDRRDSKSTDAA